MNTGFHQSLAYQIGFRISERRLAMKISSEKLARSMGVSIFELNEYELGLRTLNASRLYKVSEILEVPIKYFFESSQETGFRLNPEHLSTNEKTSSPSERAFSEIVFDDPEFHELLEVYYGISELEIRKRVIRLMRALNRQNNDGQVENKIIQLDLRRQNKDSNRNNNL